jgi:hypothetical protein
LTLRLIVTSHTSAQLSGVARFNAQLADHMGVPSTGVAEAMAHLNHGDRVLLSVKLIDMSEAETGAVEAFHRAASERGISFDLFLHTYDGLPIEDALVADAATIFCANSEIEAALAGSGRPLVLVWCPALIDIDASITRTEFTIFSFGMAHKIQLGYYELLHHRLEALGRAYTIWISTAFHEKSGFGEFDEASRQLRIVFGSRVQFLGFLSDDAVNYFIDRVRLFVAFFPKGLRANNTSAYVPMHRGCAILTNLDAYSPTWLRHDVNILDIHSLTAESLDPENLRRVAAAAKRDVRESAGWSRLVARMSEHYGG